MKRSLLSILLITVIIIIASVAFFNYSVKMSSPTVMELKMPKDENIDYETVLSKLTVVLLKNNMIYGYYGNNVRDGKTFAVTELRNELSEALKKYSIDSFVVLIKPLKAANYKNTVDVLDEMSINSIKNYAMLDVSKEEKSFLRVDE